MRWSSIRCLCWKGNSAGTCPGRNAAFLVLLEQLQPFERAVFLLREAFEYEFAEIATMLDKSEAVARFSLGTKRFWPENARVELEEVNGQAALIIRAGGQVFSVLTMDVEDGQIQAIRIIVNPDKLARV